MKALMRTRGLLAALLVPIALLSACGDDSASSTATDPGGSDTPSATESGSESASESPSPSESTSESPSETAADLPDWAACGDVWQEDAQLPLAYKGCLEGDTAVPADNLSCSSGQRIVRYAEPFYAVAGGTIYQADGPRDSDKEYLKMVRVCRA